MTFNDKGSLAARYQSRWKSAVLYIGKVDKRL
ncbi:hypothetical protein D044_4071A, partial [Vibrio parahaemolyticus EKP-026]